MAGETIGYHRLQEYDAVLQRQDTGEAIEQAQQLFAQVREAQERNEQGIYLLPRTGFNVRDQIQQLKQDFISATLREKWEEIPEEKSREAVVAGWIQKTAQDIQGYNVEYLLESGLFPIVLQIINKDGKPRLCAPLYNNKPIVETVSAKERKGSVLRVAHQVEEFLLNAKPGEMAVATSPAGWSGLKDASTQPIVYPDAQTYMWQKQENGSIRGFTVKSDMSLLQNEELLQRLGVSREALGYTGTGWENPLGMEDRLSTIAGNVAFLRNGKRIEDVIATIRDIKGSNTAFINSQGEKRTFQEILLALRNPQNLWTLDAQTQKLVDTFALLVREQLRSGVLNEKVIDTLQTALGMIILKLASLIRPELRKKIHTQTPRSPGGILALIQQIGGCNGGGMIVPGFSPRLGTIGIAPSSETCVKLKCRQCGWELTSDQEKKLANGTLTACPNKVALLDDNGDTVLDDEGNEKTKECGWKP